MRFGDCSVCGRLADVPCPGCGSTMTVRIAYGLGFSLGGFDEPVRGGCMRYANSPDRACRACGTRFLLGWPAGPMFRRSFLDGDAQMGGGTQFRSPVSDGLRDLFIRGLWQLRNHTTPDGVKVVGVVATTDELDKCLDSEVGGRAWWNDLPHLVAACSGECLQKALRRPGFVRMSVWKLTEVGPWLDRTGVDLSREPASVMHVSSLRDPVGVFAIHADADVIVAAESGIADERLLRVFEPVEPVEEPTTFSEACASVEFGDFNPPIGPRIELHTYECLVGVEFDGEVMWLGGLSYTSAEPDDPHATFTTELTEWVRDEVGSGDRDLFSRRLVEVLMVGARTFLIRHGAHILGAEGRMRTLVEDAADRIACFLEVPAPQVVIEGGCDLVYGPGSGRFVFMERLEAEALAAAWQVVERGGTLEEVQRRLDETADEIVTELIEELEVEGCFPDGPASNASWIASRIYDSQYWPWPAELDTHWRVFEALSEEIQAEAEAHRWVFTTALDGQGFYFEDPEPVAEAIRAAGGRCTRDDALVAAAHGPYGY